MTQCFHCGDVPIAINLGFDMANIDQAIKEGMLHQYWECDKCGRINYEKTRANRVMLVRLKQALGSN